MFVVRRMDDSIALILIQYENLFQFSRSKTLSSKIHDELEISRDFLSSLECRRNHTSSIVMRVQDWLLKSTGHSPVYQNNFRI